MVRHMAKRRTPSGLTRSIKTPRELPTVFNPTVADRLWSRFKRAQLPEEAEQTLARALNGDLYRYNLLVTAMLDEWPDLTAAIQEVASGVASMPWEMTAFSERKREGGKIVSEPEGSSVERADFIEDMLDGMSSDMASRRYSFPGTQKQLVLGYYYGHTVREIQYNEEWKPLNTREVDAVYYDYPRTTDTEDRLMFRPDGMGNATRLEDFPEHKFLVGVNSIHRGHPSQASPLRPLTRYWLASVFGLAWLNQYCQLFGVPFRLAKYNPSDDCTQEILCDALENIGSAGYAAVPVGTELELVESGKSGTSLPQAELIKLANEQVAKYILGQTLTTSQGDKGSQALGNVHENVRKQKIADVADWVLDIINCQLIPSIAFLNYGDLEQLPKLTRPAEEVSEDERVKMVERDVKLFGKQGLSLPVESDYMYERHGIPRPENAVTDPETGQTTGEGLLVLGPSLEHQERREDSKASKSNNSFSGKQDPKKKPGKKEEVKAERVQAEKALSDEVLEQLESNVLDEVPSMAKEWLAPASEFFRPLTEMAIKGEATEEEFERALVEAQAAVGDLELDSEVFMRLTRDAVGSAILAGGYQRALTFDKQ